MKINWFPGHMKKTIDQMKEDVKDIDVIIYVLDARAPVSCLNPSFLNVVKKKPIVFVLNKADLVDKDSLAPFVMKLSQRQKSKVVVLTATSTSSKSKIIDAIHEVLADKLAYFESKGAKITTKAMIIGVPNSGKSTIANTLAGKVKAQTGNRAGVTKVKQWVKISPYVEVLDTPGALWPNLDNEFIAQNLAFIGSIKVEVLDMEEICFKLIEKLQKIDDQAIEKRFSITIETEDTTLDIIEKIASAKGFKIRGGETDYQRVYQTLLTDYKKGKLTSKVLDVKETLNRKWNI